MRGVWLHDDPSGKTRNMKDFHDFIKSITNLRRLSLPYVANNNIVQSVLTNCHQLTFLDVSGSSEIGDAHVEKV